ncbi:MAG: hypothetical protein ACKO38_15255 [Planctomycetota bacterium]
MRRLPIASIFAISTLILGFAAWAQEAATTQTASPSQATQSNASSPDKQATRIQAKETQAQAEPTGDSPQEASVWMRRKLDYSQQILVGIAEADFERIATNAKAMRALGKVERFVRGRTPGYRSQLQIFQDATEQLIKHAEKDNVDGAALAFTQLTISCVNCHKHLRESK